MSIWLTLFILVLMVCLVRMWGLKFVAFSKAAYRDSGKSWLNLPSILSPNLLYSELVYWIHCVLDATSSIVMPGYANWKCDLYCLLNVCKDSSGFCWIELKAWSLCEGVFKLKWLRNTISFICSGMASMLMLWIVLVMLPPLLRSSSSQ